jgi:hypothetical protein
MHLSHLSKAIPASPDIIRLKYYLLLFLCLLISLRVNAQDIESIKRTRHRFAQSTIGLDFQYGLRDSQQEYQLLEGGLKEKNTLASLSSLRLLIGGTHFWGHADFYLAFPIIRDRAAMFFTGIETGGRIYPWPIRHYAVRPFMGVAFNEQFYKQKEGPLVRWFAAPVSTGLTWSNGNNLFEVYLKQDLGGRPTYYLSSSQTTSSVFPRTVIGVGYKRKFDTTVSAEKDWESGRTKIITDTLAARRKLSGITIGAGPSSSFFLRPSTHNSGDLDYVGEHISSGTFADIAVGWYSHRPDMQFQLSWRPVSSKVEAYGFQQSFHRNSLAAESYKFLFDYHGFSFFTGPSLSYESWKFIEQRNGNNIRQIKKNRWQPGVVFGWDIRPNRIQTFYLRTHLRWYPGMKLNTGDGKAMHFDQLEFNYIQLVLFPGRMF